MSSAQILVLGALAGLTIFIGLADRADARRASSALQGRSSARPPPGSCSSCSGTSSHGGDRAGREALKGAVDGGSWALRRARGAVRRRRLALGLLSLVYYDRWMKSPARKSHARPGRRLGRRVRALAWAASLSAGPLARAPHRDRDRAAQLLRGARDRPVRRAQDEISLALVLVIGFGLHNATEGFGIVAPLSGDAGARRAGASSGCSG